MVYLPGLGAEKTRWWDRLGEAWAPELAWRIGLADPHRVTTAYTVLHVDHFSPTEDSVDDWLTYDEANDVVHPTAAILADLSAFENALDTLIVPLVKERYLQWSTPAAMGQAFEAWEAACGAPVGVRPSGDAPLGSEQGRASWNAAPVLAGYSAATNPKARLCTYTSLHASRYLASWMRPAAT